MRFKPLIAIAFTFIAPHSSWGVSEFLICDQAGKPESVTLSEEKVPMNRKLAEFYWWWHHADDEESLKIKKNITTQVKQSPEFRKMRDDLFFADGPNIRLKAPLISSKCLGKEHVINKDVIEDGRLFKYLKHLVAVKMDLNAVPDMANPGVVKRVRKSINKEVQALFNDGHCRGIISANEATTDEFETNLELGRFVYGKDENGKLILGPFLSKKDIDEMESEVAKYRKENLECEEEQKRLHKLKEEAIEKGIKTYHALYERAKAHRQLTDPNKLSILTDEEIASLQTQLPLKPLANSCTTTRTSPVGAILKSTSDAMAAIAARLDPSERLPKLGDILSYLHQ